WGTVGRGFKSRRSDHFPLTSRLSAAQRRQGAHDTGLPSEGACMTVDTTASGPEPIPDTDESSRPSRATLLVYLGAMTAMFMSVLDMQIIVTALPTIAGEFDNLHLFGWVGAAYLLATAAVAPFYGKLGDLFGRRNVLLTSIVLFLLGSLACGLAWSMETLITARVLQGIGGGGLMVSAFAVI